jgi:myo-inositol-1(or 4)-monophosphatase
MVAMTEPIVDLAFLRACLVEAGQLALRGRAGVTAEVKADRSPVTALDRAVERFLIDRIANRYPGHQVLSEESGLHPSANETTWVIDPIDGTRAYASGLPIWGVSIGIFHAGAPAAGGLYLPVTGEMYWGTPQAAWVNDQPLPPTPPPDLDSPLTFLAVPSNFHLHFDISFPRARSMGSTAAHLAYTASGAATGTLLNGVSLWDMAGLLPVLAAAGIQLTALDGSPFLPAHLLDGRALEQPVLAAHPGISEALRGCIKPRQPS